MRMRRERNYGVSGASRTITSDEAATGSEGMAGSIGGKSAEDEEELAARGKETVVSGGNGAKLGAAEVLL